MSSLTDLDPSFKRLLDEPVTAVVAVLGRDEYPNLTPVWFDYEGDTVLLNLATHRKKVDWLRKAPYATLLLMNPANAYHWISIKTVLKREISEDDPAEGQRVTDQLDRIWVKYTGNEPPYALRDPSIDERRVLFDAGGLSGAVDLGCGERFANVQSRPDRDRRGDVPRRADHDDRGLVALKLEDGGRVRSEQLPDLLAHGREDLGGSGALRDQRRHAPERRLFTKELIELVAASSKRTPHRVQGPLEPCNLAGSRLRHARAEVAACDPLGHLGRAADRAHHDARHIAESQHEEKDRCGRPHHSATEHVQAGCVACCGGALAVRLASRPARSMTSTPIPTPHNVQSTR